MYRLLSPPVGVSSVSASLEVRNTREPSVDAVQYCADLAVSGAGSGMPSPPQVGSSAQSVRSDAFSLSVVVALLRMYTSPAESLLDAGTVKKTWLPSADTACNGRRVIEPGFCAPAPFAATEEGAATQAGPLPPHDG